jgi:hypothetical protein
MNPQVRLMFPFVMLLLSSTNALAQNPYPLVFDNVNHLKRYGLAIVGIDTNSLSTHFPNRCYYYGDGGWDISISNALLAAYREQGFSRRSACMALVSTARFNPESGQRLATYILINRKLIKNGHASDAGALTDELPLSLPNCFRGGLPYSDCAWNYDPISGRKLSAQQTRSFRAVGNRIVKYLSDPAVRRRFRYLEESQYTRGMIMVGAAQGIDRGIVGNAPVSFYDYSREFPKGFGYALYADGTAAPSVSAATLKAALTGKKPSPQVDPKKLRDILRTGNR